MKKLVPIEKKFSNHPKSKFWSNKNNKTPEDVYMHSQNKYWFNCDKCSHDFEKKIGQVSINSWCPYCVNQKLCDNNECKECFEKSFASSEKSKYWADKNELKPRQVFKCITNKYWFNCNNCHHDFEKQLGHISQNSWCPYCSNKKLCDNNKCKKCFEKSFASNEKSKYWSEQNKIQPRYVFNRANKKFLFNCDKCFHLYKTKLDYINSWCQYCSNRKLCDNNDCEYCFNNSFASNYRCKYWSNKNTINPRQVFKKSGKKFIFNCDKCKNEFESVIKNINNNNTWCPHCKYKTELKLYNWLYEQKFKVKSQVIFEWAKNKKYDFVLHEYKIIIELDGGQHFKQVSNWSSPEQNQINDELKNNLANNNDHKIIRVCQEMVWNDNENWEYILLNTINEVINSKIISVNKIGKVYKN